MNSLISVSINLMGFQCIIAICQYVQNIRIVCK